MRMASKLLTSMRFKLRRAPGTSAIRVAYAGYRISRCRKGSHRRSAGANLSTAFVKAASVQAQAAIIPLVGTRLKAGVVAGITYLTTVTSSDDNGPAVTGQQGELAGATSALSDLFQTLQRKSTRLNS